MLINKIKCELLRAKAYGLPLVFTIGTTSKLESEGYATPIRVSDAFVLLGCVIFNERELYEIIPFIDGVCDYIFVDAEKKLPIKSAKENLQTYSKTIAPYETGNLSGICSTFIKKSRVFEYKPNDLTVDAAWMFLSEQLKVFSNKKICIIGLGNIGSKLALKLVESGADVHVVGRDFHKTQLITQALNLVKPVGTIASVSCHSHHLSASFASDVIIGATSGVTVINKELIGSLRSNAIVIDLGKETIEPHALDFARDHGLRICRTDVSTTLVNYVKQVLSTNTSGSKFGRRIMGKHTIVSGGFLGAKGDVIVDDIDNPKEIIGIANGNGGFLTREVNSIVLNEDPE